MNPYVTQNSAYLTALERILPAQFALLAERPIVEAGTVYSPDVIFLRVLALLCQKEREDRIKRMGQHVDTHSSDLRQAALDIALALPLQDFSFSLKKKENMILYQKRLIRIP